MKTIMYVILKILMNGFISGSVCGSTVPSFTVNNKTACFLHFAHGISLTMRKDFI
jgi:hypothetical protein